MLPMPISFHETAKLAKRVVEKHTFIKPGEKVLILTDPRADSETVISLLNATIDVGGIPMIVSLPWRRTYPHSYIDWEEPPDHVVAALEASDVLINYRQPQLGLTHALLNARKKGLRTLWMTPDFDYTRPIVMDEDYDEMTRVGERIVELVRKAKKIRVTTKSGTDMEATYSNRIVSFDDGKVEKPGESDFFPGGMWNSSPLEDSANGKVVFDGSLQGIGAVQSPITITFKDGWIVDIKGKDADRWRNWLDTFGDKEIYRHSHISGGLAKKSQIIGDDWEDLPMYGSILFSGGENIYYDGANLGTAHFDGTTLNATVYLDGELLMKDGSYIHPFVKEVTS